MSYRGRCKHKHLTTAAAFSLFVSRHFNQVKKLDTVLQAEQRNESESEDKPATLEKQCDLYSLRFDTYRSKDESRRLAQYVDDVADGVILTVVVNDEGSNNLEEFAKKSLSSLGSQYISSLGFR